MKNENIKGKVNFHDANGHAVRLEYKVEDGRFSMSGDTQGHYGQCQDAIKPKTQAQKDLLKFWNEYHLNDMHAGTKKQEKAIKDHYGDKPYNYDDACNYLKSINLYSVTRPVEKNGLIIPESYRYGSGWITEKLPAFFTENLIKVIKEIEKEEAEYLKARDAKIKNTDEMITALMDGEGIDADMFDACKAYLENFYPGNNANNYDLSNFDESYQGEFDSDEDFVQQLLEDTGDIPANLPNYIFIDWERTARDVMQDYSEYNGFYFRSI